MNKREAKHLDQLWGEGSVRIFISHVAKCRGLAREIQEGLTDFGIASFVAHKDIEPAADWQSEIELALFSMDMLVALLTEGFSESKWTDQEVGVAIGREVPVVSVALGVDPYGFIGKYQAILGKDIDQILNEILSILFRRDGVRDVANNAFIKKVANADSFDRANFLARYLPMLDQLSPEQEQALVEAFNSNSQVYCAYHFYPCLPDHMKRITGNSYRLEEQHQFDRQLVFEEDIPF